MNKQKILVYDSGNGGADIFIKLKAAFLNEEFLLFKDVKNAPYGSKTKKQLLEIVKTNFDKILKSNDIKIIVLACNTISACIYNELVSIYAHMPIIPIYPNIPKTPLPCLILSTSRTKKSSLLLKNLSKNQKNNKLKNYYLVGYKTLAKKIDDNIENLDSLLPFLKQTLNIYKNQNIKSISLACTHFAYIKKQLTQIFGQVEFFENSDVIIKQLQFYTPGEQS